MKPALLKTAAPSLFKELFMAYLDERYPRFDKNIAWAEYERIIKEEGIQVHVVPTGFVLYLLRGDAAMVLDLYVVPEARRQGTASWLTRLIEKKAHRAKKCVLMTFAENEGVGKYMGEKTIDAIGFELAYSTKSKDIYVKGI